MKRNSFLAGPRLGGFGCGVFGAEEDIQDDEGGADGDGGVGDVEGGIVEGAEPNFEEIGDGAVEDTIGDVAGGAAKKKREAGGGEAAAAMAGDEKPSENGDDDERAGDENDARPGRSGIGEKTESDAGIAGANQIDEVVNYFVAPAFGGLRFEPGFGGPVEENDGEGEPEKAESRWDRQVLRSYSHGSHEVAYLDRKSAQPEGCATGA